MRWTALIIPLVLASLAAASWAMWLGTTPRVRTITARLPGTDRPPGTESLGVSIDLSGQFLKGEGVAGKSVGDWPGFRGIAGSAIYLESVFHPSPSVDHIPLIKEINAPAALWTVLLGEGYAGPSVCDGRVYVLDYDKEKLADTLRCWSLDDGQEIWRRGYNVDVKYNHGRTRTVPAVNEKVVVSLGPKCHVLCVDSASGEYKWGKDLVREYGTKVPPWYAGQCPLLDEGKLILAPAGKDVLLTALEPETGKTLWATPNVPQWTMTHSSVVAVNFGGKRMYVYCGSGGVVGVDATDGKVRWETTAWKVSMATVPSPLDLGEGRIFLSGGYGAGSMIIQLEDNPEFGRQSGKPEDGQLPTALVTKILKKLPPEEFGAEQQTPIFYQGHIYGVIPGGQMVCLDRDGNTMWQSGGKQRFGSGPFIIADGAIYDLNDTGVLSVVEANAAGFKLLGRATIFAEGHESWAPLAMVGGKLLARDLTRMVCLDLRKP